MTEHMMQPMEAMRQQLAHAQLCVDACRGLNPEHVGELVEVCNTFVTAFECSDAERVAEQEIADAFQELRTLLAKVKP
jgi:hypothetical protein